MTFGVSKPKTPAWWRPPSCRRGRGQEEAAQLHWALKLCPSDRPDPGPGHCDGCAEEKEDKAPLMSTAMSPNTLHWGRLPAATADPREMPSGSIPHACPHERGGGTGTSPAASSPGHWGTKPCSCWGDICHLQRGGGQRRNAPILVGNASSATCKGDKVHARGADSHLHPIAHSSHPHQVAQGQSQCPNW